MNATARATALEERLNTQAELIQSLEVDLKAARLSQKAAESKAAESRAAESKATESKTGKTAEVEKLTKELEAKNQTIAELQVYADEQQKKVARLRSSESETMRLKALTENGRDEIEQLTTEVTQLREALATAPPPDQNAQLESQVGAPYVLTVHAMVVSPVTILGVIFLRSAFPRVFGARREAAHEREAVHEAYKEA